MGRISKKMAERGEYEECVSAFVAGEEPDTAKRLLSDIPELKVTSIKTLFNFNDTMTALVSLLHLAAYWGWENVVTALISVHKCDANCKDERGHIPLHYAAYNGHLNIARYLINEANCIASSENNYGYTPLHLACGNGHLNIAQYLIREEKCKPLCENSSGITPLHLACEGHLEIVQYLIRDEKCDPSCTKSRIPCDTPLYYACRKNRVDIVKYLLSTGRVDPLALSMQGRAGSKIGDSALSYTATFKRNVFVLFEPFEKYKEDFPLHKLILIGDSGAGKSTFSETTVGNVHLPATAGIIPHCIQITKPYSLIREKIYFVMYDFSGQQEYYSSHAAVLEQMMRKSRATFLCMVDLTKNKEEIDRSLSYWLSFINDACSTAEGTSCVVVIGSHVDQVVSSEADEKQLVLEEIAKKRVKESQRYTYTGYLSLDCRNVGQGPRRLFNEILSRSHKVIAASQPAVIYNTYAVNEFLRTELNLLGYSLDDLFSIVAGKNYTLPSDRSVLTDILTTLNDRGIILFIHVRHDQSSWVIVDKKAFLNEIIGTIFAPVRHDDLASNTGIIHVSNLKKAFPKHDPDMLAGILTSMDFCRPVNPSVLPCINLQTTPSHSTGNLLFFPGLIQLERPNDLVQQGALEFSWCLKCVDPNEHFNSRFLHVLLLSIAFEFPLASQESVRDLKCVVWRNGIFWRNSNITTVVELENNQSVFVGMTHDVASLRSSLISLVHRLHQRCCPRINVREFPLSRDLIQQLPQNLGTFVVSYPLEAIGGPKAKRFRHDSSTPTAGGSSSSSLSIEDMADVCKFLNYFNRWQPLGLQLGLLHPTLERIDEEQRGVIEKCKMRMLAAWLQHQDNVTKKGIPSWKVLRTALVKINEKKLAERISLPDGGED